MEGQPWSPDFNIDSVSDAETLESLRTRALHALEYIQAQPANNILIVSHDSTGRMIRSIIHPNIPFNSGSENRFRNAEIIQLI
jgi:broad specificity phosphatase PhoE